MALSGDAVEMSPAAMYPLDIPRSSMDRSTPLRGIGVLAATDANRQLPFPAGSQVAGVSMHSLVVPQPVRVMLKGVEVGVGGGGVGLLLPLVGSVRFRGPLSRRTLKASREPLVTFPFPRRTV